ncbi:YicC/YloC family endoribonuclease [Capnocytophaga ochracea]|uniref:YicC family protein n=1 Tax=Capnocytophaga ochracea TaxID=1018 RepID=A0AA46WB34_CAPOC|nr:MULTISPECIES: YicC/YloC family endoribonuclease [Capnocytophaga]MDU6659943.1 YicC/YloC family endoribonuclease [Capnocytophaga sp.]MEB3017091.1 YicC/YloC family endoribonuclease [Capnocytophaga ochracea]UZD35737.1 YicC family protein [Capnocytophaga ochracea]UZD40849.1 YicC family protein [Capnocytophaga ochracea]
MIQSMTGFGKSVLSLTDKHISIEIKSLNSKSIDINTRIPQAYREKELDFRKLIAEQLLRGKVDFSIFVENTGTQTPSKINPNIVKSYIEQMRAIVDGDLTELLKMAVRMPDALQTTTESVSEEELSAIFEHISLAITDLQTFRIQEGKVLEKDFVLRISNIDSLLQEVQALDSERLALIRERLEKAVADIQSVDANRFEQELIFYLEKLDITEEKIRLKKHLDYFLETLHSEDSNGRKLSFIAQEIGREINTLGSKANFAPMQQLVVQMKDELEKIKEQVLNVL